MGCCSSEPRQNNNTVIIEKLRYSIESNNAERLSSFALVYDNMVKDQKSSLEKIFIINIQNTDLTCIAYSLWLGHVRTFRYLFEVRKCSVIEMENVFRKQNTTGIDIIATKSYLDLFKYYLPIYLKNYSNFEKFEGKFTVHKLVESGSLTMLSILMAEKQEFPKELDVNSLNEYGENGALVACRTCSLHLVKFLSDNGCDFNVVNKEGEGAVQLILNSGKDKEEILACLNVLSEKGVVIPEGALEGVSVEDKKL